MSGPTWPELGGRRIVVTGAGSGMSLVAIELSVASGASVLGATRSDRGLAAVEAACADSLRQLFAFLLSTRSSYLTGQCFDLSGGFVTW